MKLARQLALAILIAFSSVLAASGTGFSADPLPGTCGLPGNDNSTFAFAGAGRSTDVPLFDTSLMSCQAGTMDITFVRGCSADYYLAHPEHGALNLSLAQSGFRTHGGSSTTLLNVISQPGTGHGDAYLRQAVTAYLNSLYVGGYAYDVQDVLDGYHSGSITEGSFAWNNQGATTTQFVVPTCPLESSSGND